MDSDSYYNLLLIYKMSNGLEKFVEGQAKFISDTQADQFKLAYNRGILDLVRRRELAMLGSMEQPTMFGGGSKVGPLKYGLVPLKPLPETDGIDYSTLVTGGKISRLKKAKKWAAFSGDTLDKGLDLASKAKALGGDLDGGKKKRKSKKGPSVSAARDWTQFATDALTTGLDKGKEVQAALDGGKKKKVNRMKKATAWRDFSVDTVNQGLDLAQKVKGVTGSGKPRAANAWVAHVKKYAADHKVSYKEAMSQAKASYNK